MDRILVLGGLGGSGVGSGSFKGVVVSFKLEGVGRLGLGFGSFKGGGVSFNIGGLGGLGEVTRGFTFTGGSGGLG